MRGVTVARNPIPAAMALAVFKAAPTSMPEDRAAFADLCTNTVEDGEKTKQNKGQTLRYLSVRRKRASYNELILGTVFALEIKIFRYNDYSVARCHGIQKAEHGVR